LICFALVLAIGWPVVVLLRMGKGLHAAGLAVGLGLAVILIGCRAMQLWLPLAQAAWSMWLCVVVGLVAAWSPAKVRSAAMECIGRHSVHFALIGLAMAVVAAALDAPLLFGGAIQFDGSRNADSFTFVSSARYMLSHSFYGISDFDPAHPIYSVSRGYFGDGAMQPRPAAEGLLAWLSATFGADPMYLYNGLQTTGILLSGFSIMAFLPGNLVLLPRSFALILPLMLACPLLLFVAVNSNFANAFALAPATVYVALGSMPRRWGTFVAGVMAVGCLMSSYPELLVFVGGMRFLAVVVEGLVLRRLSSVVRHSGLLGLELLVSCAFFPWAAKGTFVVYKTTLEVSHAGASDQIGNMYAGLPLAIFATVWLVAAWGDLKKMANDERLRMLFVGVLLAFAVAQWLMVVRGYSYGGFKISQYFVTMLSAIVVACSAVWLSIGDGGPWRTWMRQSRTVLVAVIVAVTVWKDARVIKRSWGFAESRQVTRSLVAAGQWIQGHVSNAPVALGYTPAAFYYGHWIPYVTGVHLVYDWTDPEAAGYLSPYLRQSDSASFSDAQILLLIDDPDIQRERSGTELVTFDRVHLVRMPFGG
jgi:hypothetical protein